jgi:hypothetical protein
MLLKVILTGLMLQQLLQAKATLHLHLQATDGATILAERVNAMLNGGFKSVKKR